MKIFKVRGLLYKLRVTWGEERHHVFTDFKLYQLDKRVKTLDPAWPLLLPKGVSRPEPTKQVNYHFVEQVIYNECGIFKSEIAFQNVAFLSMTLFIFPAPEPNCV